MIDLEQFKANSIRHGICEMIDDWNNAKSKKQLIDLCLSIRGIQYVSDAIACGWGISPEIIANEFSMFLNGKYTRDKDGYTSQMYCLPPEDKDININSTVTLIIGFNGTIRVNKKICELYIVNSDCVIVGNGAPRVYAYNSNIKHPDIPLVIKENK